ncbi:NAD(P)/FAD-dependent oxidoreductase [Alicyclobacillus fastidiosus]|nr:NAD(P)/FAD-dependent oxidoreductase [Alicyclobacillus fastidiosus]GMA65599.1 ferredoxin--NADP reductase 2 [Alicyclobacillus fastidiosus]GMA65715.1 ferredoxin--NADP reductase 2 [Alicyclobacillus fastidiosus]
MESIKDILIIGGGPTGLFASFYCGMRNASCSIIDSLPTLGGQLATLYPEKYIYDVAGFPKIRAIELVKQLIQQSSESNPEVYLNESVQALDRRENGLFELRTDKSIHFGRAVIICAGIGGFKPRPLPIDNANDYRNNGIYYFIDDLKKFENKKVLIVGGGDSAVDYALMLSLTAQSVTLVHRRNEFRAHEESIRQLQNSSVRILTPFELSSINGTNGVDEAIIVNNQNGDFMRLDIDVIVSGLGFSASLGPIKDWGLETFKNEIVVNSKMETNIPGVYAAGDIVTYPGKVKLIATGFGEAPTAVNNAITFIRPNERLSPGHSSNRKEPVGS